MVAMKAWGLDYGHGDPATDDENTPRRERAECAICSAHAGTQADPIPFHQFQPVGTPIDEAALAERGGFGFTIPDEDNPEGWMR